MKLAVLRPVGHSCAGANISLKCIEAKSNNLSCVLAMTISVKTAHEPTVPSGERSVVTVPWGHPLPEVEAPMILIRSPSGLPVSKSIGVAATRAGTSRTIAERIVTRGQTLNPFIRKKKCCKHLKRVAEGADMETIIFSIIGIACIYSHPSSLKLSFCVFLQVDRGLALGL